MLLRKAVATCWISKSLKSQLLQEADIAFPDETGGVLIGYWAGPADVVMTAAIPAGPKSVHRAYAFEPDWEFQQNEVARYYAASGRLHTYLGDWHTYPHGLLRLSRRDRGTLKLIAAHVEARAPKALMLLLAGGHAWKLGVWRACTGGRVTRYFLMPIRMKVVFF
jgi:integrative and conjugative element protein (TIGR02256 family)